MNTPWTTTSWPISKSIPENVGYENIWFDAMKTPKLLSRLVGGHDFVDLIVGEGREAGRADVAEPAGRHKFQGVVDFGRQVLLVLHEPSEGQVELEEEIASFDQENQVIFDDVDRLDVDHGPLGLLAELDEVADVLDFEQEGEAVLVGDELLVGVVLMVGLGGLAVVLGGLGLASLSGALAGVVSRVALLAALVGGLSLVAAALPRLLALVAQRELRLSVLASPLVWVLPMLAALVMSVRGASRK